MTSNNPPDRPNRRIEIVPLPASGTPSARLFSERGAWREPAVVTSTHEPVQCAPRPDPAEGLWVISPAPEAPSDFEPAANGAQSRLRALLLRERTALLSQIDSGATTAPRAPADQGAAPFPLPAMPVADTSPRRTPKARRPDASARPLAADVAAAIARATGHEQPPPPAPSLVLVRRTTARQRLDIVTLPELPITPAETPADAPPARVAPPESKHRIIDLRERRRLRGRAPVAYLCPKCDRKGVVDIIDNVTGQVSATCSQCLEMWTIDLHPDHAPVDPN